MAFQGNLITHPWMPLTKSNLMFVELPPWYQAFWRRQRHEISGVTVYKVKKIIGNMMGNTEVAEDVGGYDKVGKLEAP